MKSLVVERMGGTRRWPENGSINSYVNGIFGFD